MDFIKAGISFSSVCAVAAKGIIKQEVIIFHVFYFIERAAQLRISCRCVARLYTCAAVSSLQTAGIILPK